MYLAGMQQRALADSVVWFPDIHSRGDWEQILHFTLGLAGETGELVNIIKKANRTSSPYQYLSGCVGDLEQEMADVLIYLMNLAESLGLDLEKSVNAKREVLKARWGTTGE
jgi:NTP pyrophosphatase (non-canonical NTP hydrolase)